MAPMPLPIPANTKFVATLPHVREVSLLGRADLAYWEKRLQAEDLYPANIDGQAGILIGATDSVYLGKAFREFTICVLSSRRHDEPAPEGVFLVQAINSVRFFAWVERTCFATPYFHGVVELKPALPASVKMTFQNQVVFAAQMGDSASRSPETMDYGFSGPVFLPRNRQRSTAASKFFYARIQGQTTVIPFDPRLDQLELGTASADSCVESLRASRFTVTHWHLRPDAQHAKAKTLSRDRLPAIAQATTG